MMTIEKDPDETRAIVWDFTNECNAFATPTTVSTATFLVPTGISRTTQAIAAKAVSGTFTGGTSGKVYLVTCRATFANGDTRDKTSRVVVREQ